MLLAQIVRSGLLIDKLRKAVPVLFRCPKIRKAKPACFTFSRSDVNGVQRAILGSRSLVLPSVAEHHCVSTDTLRFSNFLPKSQKHSRLCAICQPPGCEALFGFNIIYFDAGIPLILMRCLINVIAGCRSDHKHCANDCRAPDCLTAEDRN